ncbi:MAG: hypothetical protein ABI233_13005 [Chthoniobacterales bacterium]
MLSLVRATTIVALCLSLGLHWLALQSLAWTTMLVENVRHAPLSEAVARTFDGSHPCHLCRAVAEGKKSKRKSEILPTVAKLDLICPPRLRTWQPRFVPYDYGVVILRIVQRNQSPPTPPPRSLLG